MRRLWLIVIFIVASAPSYAQEATEEAVQGWPVVERCVGEATAPPDDWTFDGTILATGWAGIHGIKADWDTPYVIQFGVRQGHLSPLIFSPDMRWIAQTDVKSVAPPGLMGRVVTIGNIHVYDTESRKSYTLDMEDTMLFVTFIELYAWVPYTPWWDNDKVIIAQDDENLIAWDFENDTEVTIPFTTDRLLLWNPIASSPDWTRAVSLIEIRSERALYDLTTNEALLLYEFNNVSLSRALWLADSSAYVMPYYEKYGEISSVTLRMYTRDGDSFEVISNRGEGMLGKQISIVSNWQYLAFHYTDFDKIMGTLPRTIQIANLKTHEVISTCLEADSYVWSPNSTQLALMGIGSEQREILIFDVETWQLYSTGIYHDGTLLGWREDVD